MVPEGISTPTSRTVKPYEPQEYSLRRSIVVEEYLVESFFASPRSVNLFHDSSSSSPIVVIIQNTFAPKAIWRWTPKIITCTREISIIDVFTSQAPVGFSLRLETSNDPTIIFAEDALKANVKKEKTKINIK